MICPERHLRQNQTTWRRYSYLLGESSVWIVVCSGMVGMVWSGLVWYAWYGAHGTPLHHPQKPVSLLLWTLKMGGGHPRRRSCPELDPLTARRRPTTGAVLGAVGGQPRHGGQWRVVGTQRGVRHGGRRRPVPGAGAALLGVRGPLPGLLRREVCRACLGGGGMADGKEPNRSVGGGA